MDLLGRKVTIKKGKAFTLYLEELNKTIKMAEAIPSLAAATAELKRAAEILQKVTGHLIGIAMKGNAELFLADATLYLEFPGSSRSLGNGCCRPSRRNRPFRGMFRRMTRSSTLEKSMECNISSDTSYRRSKVCPSA